MHHDNQDDDHGSQPTLDGPYRYELKFACERSTLPNILHWLCLDHDAVRPHHPSRTIQSLYFDTHDGRHLNENLAGISEREKIRLRWYGRECESIYGILERKLRRNKLGCKRRFHLAEPIQVADASRVAIMQRLIALVDAQWRELLAYGLEPSQWITYDRRYLRTFDGHVRLTVDQNIRAYDQRNRIVLSRRFRTPLPDVVIIEFKSDAKDADRLQELVQRCPVMLDRCSKFVLACQPPAGPALSLSPHV